jgi:Mating-type protein MAT alpha 1 HMG-box
MAFRAYYNGALGTIPQKDKSAALRKLWEAAEPYHPVFAVIGKAYSIIRDKVGKDKAPLNGYLALVGKALGLVEPCNVLDAFGFESLTALEGTQFYQTRDPNLFRHQVINPVGCDEILRLCAANGYLSPLTGKQSSRFSCSELTQKQLLN